MSTSLSNYELSLRGRELLHAAWDAVAIACIKIIMGIPFALVLVEARSVLTARSIGCRMAPGSDRKRHRWQRSFLLANASLRCVSTERRACHLSTSRHRPTMLVCSARFPMARAVRSKVGTAPGDRQRAWVVHHRHVQSRAHAAERRIYVPLEHSRRNAER